MEKAFIILTAMALNIAFGAVARFLPLQRIQMYAAIPGAFLRDMERRLNREHRSVDERQRRGVLLVGFAVCVALCVGWFAGMLPAPVQSVLIAAILPLSCSMQRMGRLRSFLQADKLNAARDMLAGTVFRHHALLDAHAAARAGVEYLAVQLFEKIVAPICWYLLLGLPGLLASYAVSMLQENLCGAGAEPPPFGKAAQQAHHLFHYIPARIAAGLWVAGAVFLPGLAWKPAAEAIYAQLSAQSPHRTALLSAASTLGLALGGPVSAYCNDAWIGAGRAKAMPHDIQRAQFLYMLTLLFIFVGLGVFVL